ncbi:MAG: DUF4189 domain-containing protein [Rhodospirillaceae bacterium]|nr:DUF4189 domain-containing protein [Rhodospirillaceae bacterium]
MRLYSSRPAGPCRAAAPRRVAAAPVLLALAASCALALPAQAACGDRPGTPITTRVEAVPGNASMLRLTWRDTTRADERVWWDFQVTDAGGRIVQSLAGVGIGAMVGSKQFSNRDFGPYPAGATRCFRMKARTAAGTKGCVSQLWSGRICGTVAAAPAAPKGGGFAALAANGKGFWGYAVGQSSEAAARSAALKGCGQADCRIAISGRNKCVAYYESRRGGYWYGLALGPSVSYVRRTALGGCAKGAPAGTCRLVKQICS